MEYILIIFLAVTSPHDKTQFEDRITMQEFKSEHSCNVAAQVVRLRARSKSVRVECVKK